MVGGKELSDSLVFVLEGFLVISFFAVEANDEEEAGEVEVDDEDFILAISANKAGVRVLTTASRSDWFDRDLTAAVSSSFLARLSALLDFFR